MEWLRIDSRKRSGQFRPRMPAPRPAKSSRRPSAQKFLCISALFTRARTLGTAVHCMGGTVVSITKRYL